MLQREREGENKKGLKELKPSKLCFLISDWVIFPYLSGLWGIVRNIPWIKLPDGGNNFWRINKGCPISNAIRSETKTKIALCDVQQYITLLCGNCSVGTLPSLKLQGRLPCINCILSVVVCNSVGFLVRDRGGSRKFRKRGPSPPPKMKFQDMQQ